MTWTHSFKHKWTQSVSLGTGLTELDCWWTLTGAGLNWEGTSESYCGRTSAEIGPSWRFCRWTDGPQSWVLFREQQKNCSYWNWLTGPMTSAGPGSAGRRGSGFRPEPEPVWTFLVLNTKTDLTCAARVHGDPVDSLDHPQRIKLQDSLCRTRTGWVGSDPLTRTGVRSVFFWRDGTTEADELDRIILT